MSILITTPIHNDDGGASLLANTAEIIGWEVHKPIGSWRMPDYIRSKDGAVYGEPLFCEVVADQMNWTLTSNSYNWLATLPEDYVKRNISFMTLAAARAVVKNQFVKPIGGNVFTAKVYADGNELPQHPALDELPVLVSDKVKFQSEYRCFVKDREVVSVSCYVYYGTEHLKSNWHFGTEPAIEFVNNLLRDDRVACAPGAVIDVGKLKDGEMAIIGSKPAYMSDLFGCEIVGSLDAIKAACVKAIS